MSELSTKEQIRYSRQIMLDGMGVDGQLMLKNATVLVVGCGGLGNPALLYLAASGVGHIKLMDDDEVELSNLQRQIAFKVSHLGQSKAKAAAKVLGSLNNEIELEVINQKAEQANLETLVKGCDVVLDCTDNFATRFLINRVCVQAKVPLVSGAAIAFEGQLGVFDNRDSQSPCYACLFTKQPTNEAANCDSMGVVSPLLGVIGAQQAMLALQVILRQAISQTWFVYDAQTLQQRSFNITKNPDCWVCSSVNTP